MPRNVLIIQESYSKKPLIVNENNSKVLKNKNKKQTTEKDNGNTTETIGTEKERLNFKTEKVKSF